MQNSQRVLLAKPRTAVATATDNEARWREAVSHRGRESRPSAKPHGRCARQRGTGGGRGNGARARARDAKPRTAPMARRRDEDIAPYRHAARAVRTARGTGGAHGDGHGRCVE